MTILRAATDIDNVLAYDTEQKSGHAHVRGKRGAASDNTAKIIENEAHLKAALKEQVHLIDKKIIRIFQCTIVP